MPNVELHTSHGIITLELFPEKAPITVANFLSYAEKGHYDFTIFHRVINDFMIQGGGFEPGMHQKGDLDAPIENEAGNGLKNDKYTVAMARTSDPHSATAEFFINVTHNKFLNFTAKTVEGYGYAVFGNVVNGFDVVDAIKCERTGRRRGRENVPMSDVFIEKVVIL